MPKKLKGNSLRTENNQVAKQKGATKNTYRDLLVFYNKTIQI